MAKILRASKFRNKCKRCIIGERDTKINFKALNKEPNPSHTPSSTSFPQLDVDAQRTFEARKLAYRNQIRTE